jgi:hypothetical protein
MDDRVNNVLADETNGAANWCAQKEEMRFSDRLLIGAGTHGMINTRIRGRHRRKPVYWQDRR